jgi:uncharacterized membrane protein
VIHNHGANVKARRQGKMARYLIGYVAAAAVMAALDMVWLRFAVKAIYEPAIGTLLSEHTNQAAAALF